MLRSTWGSLLPVRFSLTAPSRKAVRSAQSVKSRTTPLAVLLTSAESDVGRADGHFTVLFRPAASPSVPKNKRPPTNARATLARSGRPASVTPSRITGPAIRHPALPAAFSPGTHAERADTRSTRPLTSSRNTPLAREAAAERDAALAAAGEKVPRSRARLLPPWPAVYFTLALCLLARLPYHEAMRSLAGDGATGLAVPATTALTAAGAGSGGFVRV